MSRSEMSLVGRPYVNLTRKRANRKSALARIWRGMNAERSEFEIGTVFRRRTALNA
jgi:hypothetical protein